MFCVINCEKIKAALGFPFRAHMVWCAPRLIAKRPNLRFTQDLADQGPLACAGQIDQVIFRDTITYEAVFFHRASNAILVTSYKACCGIGILAGDAGLHAWI